MVAIDLCSGAPHQNTDPSADQQYTYSCNDGQTIYSSEYGDYLYDTSKFYEATVDSIVMYGFETQSCEPAIYWNKGCEEGYNGDSMWKVTLTGVNQDIADVPGTIEVVYSILLPEESEVVFYDNRNF